MQKIIVQLTRSNNGGVVAVQIETAGFEGKACEQATAGLEAALGGVVGDRQWKPEATAPAVLSSHKARNDQQLQI